jgi:hypothetical protein
MNYLNCIIPTSLVILTLATPNLASGQLGKNHPLASNQTILLASQKTQSTKPATKKATLYIEGEKSTITLKLYQNLVVLRKDKELNLLLTLVIKKMKMLMFTLLF